MPITRRNGEPVTQGAQKGISVAELAARVDALESVVEALMAAVEEEEADDEPAMTLDDDDAGQERDTFAPLDDD